MNKGLFKPTVMFFGMCNSPATFQSIMDSIFRDLIKGCIVIIYMDNIFLFANTPWDLENNTKKVLQRLWENDLFLKLAKCEISKTKIEWLGMIIEKRGKSLWIPVECSLVTMSGQKGWSIVSGWPHVTDQLNNAKVTCYIQAGLSTYSLASQAITWSRSSKLTFLI